VRKRNGSAHIDPGDALAKLLAGAGGGTGSGDTS
jgi:hypothetical protein